MPYVIAEPCIDVKNGACVEVCPVDCIHTTPEDRQHYIDPDVCIECEQCVLVCPVEAVFLDRELPPQWAQYVETNAAFFQRRKQATTAVSAERAHSIILAAQTKATELGAAVSVAVVDRDGKVIAEESMPSADPGSADDARLRAAATASAFDVPAEDRTSVLIASGPKGSYVQTLGRLKTQSGTLPIVDGVNFIGAIGVAGGSDQQNHEACRVGLTGH
jgi:ferredoxin